MLNDYMCHISPSIVDGEIIWQWTIASGGGWTKRGGLTVETNTEGCARSSFDAVCATIDALRDLGEQTDLTPY
jgi:hypothetical protein